MRGEFIDVAGTRLYYYAAGTRGGGEPVVLLHGFPTSSHLWAELVPLLPHDRRIVVLDLLGFGRSDRPGGRDVSLRGHAERTIGFLDALGINYACIVGHDTGGGIAQQLAIGWPTRVSRLCLVNSVAFDAWPARETRLARAMMPLTRHLPPAWLLSVVRTDLLRGYAVNERGTHSVDRYLKPFASADGRAALHEHLTALDAAQTMALVPRLAQIAAPTAVVWGEDDPFLPGDIGRRLASSIPGATFELVRGGRHFIAEEAPEQVARAIRALLDRH